MINFLSYVLGLYIIITHIFKEVILDIPSENPADAPQGDPLREPQHHPQRGLRVRQVPPLGEDQEQIPGETEGLEDVLMDISSIIRNLYQLR